MEPTTPAKPHEREMVTFWDDQFDASKRKRAKVLARFFRYAGYIEGEMKDVTAAAQRFVGCKREDVIPVNIMSLVARRWLASMMYRNPRAHVEALNTFSKTFTPELASVETRLLNDWIEDSDLFSVGRKGLLDGFLADIMVFKVGFSDDHAMDSDDYAKSLEEAQKEDLAYLSSGKRPIVTSEQDHRAHIEQHRRTIAEAEAGTNPYIQLADKRIEYLRKHVKKHEKRAESQPESDTHRLGRVFISRIAPHRFSYDTDCETFSQASWAGEEFMRPVDVVHADERYDGLLPDGTLARLSVQASELDENAEIAALETPGPDRIPQALIREVIDMGRKKVITYAKGCPVPLRVVDYPLAAILPSGPYIVTSFIEGPVSDTGIPLPTYFEAHQRAATIMATLTQDIARRGRPVRPYDAAGLTTTEIEQIRKAEATGLVPLTKITGKKIQDVIMDLPPVPVPPQNLLIEDRHVHRAEQLSGFGSAPLGGGEQSKTATAATIVSESNSVSVEDAQAVWDNTLTQILRRVLRLMRAFYDRQLVAELVGEDALELYPLKWTKREIVQDKNARVVQGSSRRRDSAVEANTLATLYTGVIMPDPLFQAQPAAKIEILQRLLDSFGLFGVDLSGIKRMAEIQAALQVATMAAGAGAGPPGSPQDASGGAGGPNGQPGAKRPSEAVQGPGAANEAMQHQGGNRMKTGASKGDKPRLMRNEAAR